MDSSIQVQSAEPYRYGELGSLGRASGMLIRQFQFPSKYSPEDKFISADGDRCLQWDHDHARRCFTEHTGKGELGLGDWVGRATDEQMITFIVDLLKADASVEWTGYRVLGTVNRSNGFPVWTLQLFAKHPDSDTEVFTGPGAPNVLKGPRRPH